MYIVLNQDYGNWSIFKWYNNVFFYFLVQMGPSWSWSYGRWIYIYLCLPPPLLCIKIQLGWCVLDTPLCDSIFKTPFIGDIKLTLYQYVIIVCFILNVYRLKSGLWKLKHFEVAICLHLFISTFVIHNTLTFLCYNVSV
jgi:hypothetical protein